MIAFSKGVFSSSRIPLLSEGPSMSSLVADWKANSIGVDNAGARQMRMGAALAGLCDFSAVDASKMALPLRVRVPESSCEAVAAADERDAMKRVVEA